MTTPARIRQVRLDGPMPLTAIEGTATARMPDGVVHERAYVFGSWREARDWRDRWNRRAAARGAESQTALIRGEPASGSERKAPASHRAALGLHASAGPLLEGVDRS